MPSGISQLQQAIQTQRARLLQGDARLQATIVKNWQAAITRLDANVKALQAQIAETGAATPGQVFALDRWAALKQQMTQEIAHLAGDTGVAVTQAQAAAAQLALTDAQAQIAGALTIAKGPSATASFARLPVGAVQDVIGSMQPGSPLYGLFAGIAMDAPGIAEEALTSGLALGQGPGLVADAIAKAIDVSTTRAMTIARNSMLGAYRSAALNTYQQNSDVLDGWQWSAAMSGNTCAACLSLSGQTFPVSVQFFPSHVNCRCAAIPVVKGLSPLIKEGEGADYFDGLNPAQQDQILGRAGGAAYRAGQVQLSDFVARRESDLWGTSYSQGSLRQALQGGDRVVIPAPESQGVTVALNPGQPVPQYSPAKTFREAAAYTKSLGLENVSFGTANMTQADKARALKAVNLMNKTMTEMKARGLPLPKNAALMNYKQVDAIKNAIASYSPDHDRFGINFKAPFWNAPTKEIVRLRESGWLAGKTPEDIFVHEYGHFRDASLPSWSTSRLIPLTPEEGEIALKVSRYAAANQKEFVAETFVKLWNGEAVPDDVLALYKQFGGPEI